MDLDPLLLHDQFGGERLPIGISHAGFEIAVLADRIVDPGPFLPPVDPQRDPGLLHIHLIKLEGKDASVEGGMIARGGQSWLAFLLA